MALPAGWKTIRRHRGHQAVIGSFTWSPDGTRIAAPDASGRLVIWDPAKSSPLQVVEVGRLASAAAWSPDGQTIAVAVADPTIEADRTWAELRYELRYEWEQDVADEYEAASAAGYEYAPAAATVR